MALCYKDRAFCSSDCVTHLCYRYASSQIIEEASDFGLPIAWADFSDSCPEYRPPKRKGKTKDSK